MDGRERFLAAISRQRADRLPCQVHSWMDYYLRTYLGGCDQFAAYAHFGMDPVIYAGPHLVHDPAGASAWQWWREDHGVDASGNTCWSETLTTPDGVLRKRCAANQFTGWDVEHLIKDERDFAIWARHHPRVAAVDWAPVIAARNRIGAHGIVRGGYCGYGQGSPWQDFCYLHGTQEAIMDAHDRPDWVHHCLRTLLAMKLETIERGGRIHLDLVETGGGAGSSTVISPRMFREFCLPYDRQQIAALHGRGTRVVYHLCGGLMPMLELVADTGADGLETMTPRSMGGDCDLAAAYRRVHDRLFLIGGFDQNRGFERGDPAVTRGLVRELHAACPDGGYICSPSDHFFTGGIEVVQAFADEARNCTYAAAATCVG